MMKKLLWLSAISIAAFYAQSASASGDYGCMTEWDLAKVDYEACNNVVYLAPGNDTIINMQLLVVDSGKAEILLPVKKPEEERSETDYLNYPNTSFFAVREFEAEFITDRKDEELRSADNSELAYGEGSRCVSSESGAIDFIAALDQSRDLPSSERDALKAARMALKPDCGIAEYVPPVGVKSKTGLQFVSYLSGAHAFYGGSFDTAQSAFSSLNNSKQPWLKEASQYMVARIALNAAQVNAFGEYGDLQRDKLDMAELTTAEKAFQSYLGDYKDGQYAASARGLLRRVYWLSGQSDKLAKEIVFQLTDTQPKLRSNSLTALAYEADQKLLPGLEIGNVKDPLLLATLDLAAMRTLSLSDDTEEKAKQIAASLTYDKLSAQKDIFKAQEGLFSYLLAAHQFYRGNNPKAALDHLPATTATQALGPLEFSTQVLRALALEADKQSDKARAAWQHMIPLAKQPGQSATLQLGLAMNYERAKQVGTIFAAGTPITNPAIREIILRNIAGPKLLATQAKAKDASTSERREAQYVLLYKDLIHGQYAAFERDSMTATPYPATPDTYYNRDFGIFAWPGVKKAQAYACPGVRDVAKALAVDPAAAGALLCLGEFVRINGLDNHDLDTPPATGQLGSRATEFPGAVFSRGEAYKKIIANPKATKNERAYALYRAVNCYAPGGYNSCGGTEVSQSQRKKWFQTLKTQYKDTDWAVRLEYYW